MGTKPKAETETVAIEQRNSPRVAELGEDLDPGPDIAVPAGGYRDKEDNQYFSDLAFMEEPVKVVITGSQDDAGYRFTDYVAVNGQEAAVFENGRWVSRPYLPKDQEIVIKRKFVDVLLRAKRDKIRTHTQQMGMTVVNEIIRTTVPTLSVQLLEDRNPRGPEWFRKRYSQNF